MIVETADAQIHMEVFGNDPKHPPLLLIHGLGGSGRSWGDLPERFATDRRVGAVDLRGCGRSEPGLEPITIRRLADDCRAAIEETWGTACHLLGHSLGGVVVQEMLVRSPSICRAAVLVSTSSKVGAKAAESWRRLADVVEKRGLSAAGGARSFSEAFAEKNREVVATHARIAASTSPAVYAAQARAASSYDYGPLLATVANPVLVVQGLEDRLTSAGGAVLLSRALPNATLTLEPHVGHNAHLELGSRFVEIVREFLTRHDSYEGV